MDPIELLMKVEGLMDAEMPKNKLAIYCHEQGERQEIARVTCGGRRKENGIGFT